MDHTERVHEVFRAHGVDPSDLDVAIEGPHERVQCPVCEAITKSAPGLATHTRIVHEARIIELICGREEWVAILEELHINQGVSPGVISKAIPIHTAENTIKEMLREYDMYRPSSGYSKGLAGRLERMTADEFDAMTGAD